MNPTLPEPTLHEATGHQTSFFELAQYFQMDLWLLEWEAEAAEHDTIIDSSVNLGHVHAGPLSFVYNGYNGSLPSLRPNPYTWTKVCTFVLSPRDLLWNFFFSIKCSSLQIFSTWSSKYFMSSGRGLPKIIWLTCFFTSGRSKYKYNFFLHEDDVVKVLEVRGCQQYFYSFHCTESMMYIYYRHSIFYMSMPQLEPDSPTRKHKWAIPLAILSPRSSLTNSWGRSVKLGTNYTRNYND